MYIIDFNSLKSFNLSGYRYKAHRDNICVTGCVNIHDLDKYVDI